ncbi:MAG TPA: tRNA (adenosine(37)-N6)-threonylcarbamoyltransferase complex transferase subunit TsaD [Phycisphaerales bacterium]|nr:tRNA (adenosine(37)-N6)-threonylcarbamoyltransferase complex transferase subunit TsaD [Phycisphaerales bacterium]
MSASGRELVLGIETSCDETAAAVVRGGREVVSNVIASQHDLHAEYRGVVPEIASRAHAQAILPVVRRALAQAGVGARDLAGVAVGNRPGLIGSLLVGVAASKGLAWSLGVPIVGVDHVHAHLFAGCLDREEPALPALGLVVSGGHTSLYRCASFTAPVRIGATIDDAAGEAFDKAAAILGLPYPGGPNLDRLAQRGDPRAVKLPVSRLAPESLDFSFSGLKTALLYLVRPPAPAGDRPTRPTVTARPQDLAAGFQHAVVGALTLKLRRALDRHPDCRTLIVGGGVSANSLLRSELTALAADRGLDLRLPALEYCVDNAAMIAGLGTTMLRGRGWVGDPPSLTASPSGRP